MIKLLIRWLGNALGLYIASRIVSGIEIGNNWVTILLVALIFGLVNALIGTVLKFLTCPLIVLTLGLFTLVINAGLLLLTSALSRAVGLPFSVQGFWPALWGGLIVSIVSLLLTLFVRDEGRPRRQQ